MWFTLLNIVDIPRLSPASIIQRIGGARAGLTVANRRLDRSRARYRPCASSHLQHAPADSPPLFGGQPHLGQGKQQPLLAGDLDTVATNERVKLPGQRPQSAECF